VLEHYADSEDEAICRRREAAARHRLRPESVRTIAIRGRDLMKAMLSRWTIRSPMVAAGGSPALRTDAFLSVHHAPRVVEHALQRGRLVTLQVDEDRSSAGTAAATSPTSVPASVWQIAAG
jgi:hypothetical protein